MSELFNTAEERESAVNIFKSLLDSPGWQLIEKILDENIELVKKNIIDGTENETKETIDRLRDKLKVHEELRNLPKIMIKTFTTSETQVPEADPY
ncbi:MAG: hypothetical protein NUV73_04440 [Candidatus Daviesbacteria bacterium]|nr:hypothetical protein [Candidatus Daviesbacteria bacterium]